MQAVWSGVDDFEQGLERTCARFLQADPSGYPAGVNLYVYVGNDPLNATDPNGLAADAAVAILPAASTTAGDLGIGGAATAGAVMLPLLALSGDTRTDQNSQQFVYVTYTRTNSQTGEVYSGRTSGFADPTNPTQLQAIATARGFGQTNLTAEGFSVPQIDQATDNYSAIRGREQQLIDYYGGALR